MSLSLLTKYSREQYQGLTITPFPTKPSASSSGTIDPNVTISLDGWVDDNLMAFTITNAPSTSTALGISSASADTVAIAITNDNNPAAETTYWTVNCGTDGPSSNWSLSFAETSRAGSGTWVFTKGKTGEDLPY